jgi:hypothetical protein
VGEEVRVPITLDHALIREVLVQQAFTRPGQRALVVDAEAGCVRIELWKPEVSSEGAFLKVGSRIRARAGLPALGSCIGMTEWEGYVEVLQRVRLDASGLRVRLEVADARFFETDRRRATIATTLWDLIKEHLHLFLDTVQIDLTGPLQELKGFLPAVFSRDARDRVGRMLESLRLERVRVDPDAVRLDLRMETGSWPGPSEPLRVLSPAEFDRITRSWEAWDSFLVLELTSLAGRPITPEERSVLLHTLVETREAFVQALARKDLVRDPVREGFVRAWSRLAPILRRHLVPQPSQWIYSYFSIFTASDVLAFLDSAGPAMGIEISRDGLLRLVRLLKGDADESVLGYPRGVDPQLRHLLGLGPPLDESGPAVEQEELEVPGGMEGAIRGEDKVPALPRERPQTMVRTERTPNMAEIEGWIPPAGDPGSYLQRVRRLLEDEAQRAKSRADALYQPLYPTLVLATAWQESCWRHFVKRGGKLTYLRSYNGTSVGLMQINERVWRGIYRLESLRWNVPYNARAGTEILDLYLRDEAIPRLGRQGGPDLHTMTRAVYAMYNAGPSDLPFFLKRLKGASLNPIDERFWEKYNWTRQGRLDKLSLCFQGK